jgi:hypothetical protein
MEESTSVSYSMYMALMTLGRQMHTAEKLIPNLVFFFKVEVTVEKQKICKSPGIDQILAELIQAVGNM